MQQPISFRVETQSSGRRREGLKNWIKCDVGWMDVHGWGLLTPAHPRH